MTLIESTLIFTHPGLLSELLILTDESDRSFNEGGVALSGE